VVIESQAITNAVGFQTNPQGAIVESRRTISRACRRGRSVEAAELGALDGLAGNTATRVSEREFHCEY
jgi:hypothetical protein